MYLNRQEKITKGVFQIDKTEEYKQSGVNKIGINNYKTSPEGKIMDKGDSNTSINFLKLFNNFVFNESSP